VIDLRALLPILLLAGCEAPPRADPFRATGETIAFGGGDGGPAAACATCHGLRGEGDGRLTPRLAGLDAGYLHRQLDDYVNGRREHREMRAIARKLSGEDRAKVSAFYAALDTPVAPAATSSALGQQLYERGDPARGIVACASCNGSQGGPGNPSLAGQPAAYVQKQLTDWRTARRNNDALGQMRAISRQLTAAEAAAVSAHVAALPAQRRPQARAAYP
jgi:cytochrome c553